MMRWLLVAVLTLAVLSCAVRKPTMRDAVVGKYQRSNRSEIMTTLSKVLTDRKISISKTDLQRGRIVTDSFEVAPEYCDCGMNFFGAQYPGTRRGQMNISVSGEHEIDVRFEFATLLTIKANNRKVNCTSFGLLENEILAQLEKSLGIVRVNAQN